jgi:hypothetical protein
MTLIKKQWQEMMDRIEVIESLTRAPEINSIRREQILKQVKALKVLIKGTLSQINPSE